MDDTLKKKLEKELLLHAKAVGIPEGSAEVFVQQSLEAVSRLLKKSSIITEQDLMRLLSKELKKYNADLAYVYQIYDKII